MSKFSNTIEYSIQTKLDSSGLDKLQKQLSSVQKSFLEMQKASSNSLDMAKAEDGLKKVQTLQKALAKSFDSNLGITNLSKFFSELDKAGTSFSTLEEAMSATAEGQKAFNSMVGAVGQIDTGFKSISSVTDKIMNTFGNTVRWGITASIFQTIQNSLYRSVDYVKELDTSLNNIQVVTGATSENLRDFSKTANEAAQQLGASTVAFTDAAQLYAQNGYSQEDYTKLAELTTKVANVTQQSTSDVSEQITSLMAGYKMSIDEAEDSLSGMAVVAAESASDLGELANAEQKVASAANTLGVSQDQLTAQLSTIISVTREAPESVGNSLKTIYARLGDLKLGDTLEDGVSLGDVSSTLEKIGVSVMDVNGDMRAMGDILEDLMGKWQDLSTAQQQAAAVKLAGKYQYNNFMTLMSNSDMYYQQKEMAGNSQGALDEQQAIYMDSLQAKIQKLQTTWEGFVNDLVDPNAFKPALDGLSDMINGVSDLVDTLGGATPVMTLFSSMMLKSFSKSIASGVSNMMVNVQRQGIQKNNERIIQEMGAKDTSTNSSALKFVQGTADIRSTLTEEQAAEYDKTVKRLVDSNNALIDAQQSAKAAAEDADQVIAHETTTLNGLATSLNNSALTLGENRGFAEIIASAEGSREDIVNSKALREAANESILSKLTPYMGENGDYGKKLSSLMDRKTVATSDNFDNVNILKDLKEMQGDGGLLTLFDGVSDDVVGVNEHLQDLRNSFNQINEEIRNADMDADAESLDKSLTSILSKMENLQKEIAQIGEENVPQELAQQIDDLTKKEEQYNEAIRSASAAKEAQSKKEVSQKDLENASLKDLNSQLGAYQETQRTATQKYTQSLVDMASAAGNLFFAMQSLQNLGSIWSDDDMDTGEKILATIQNMIFAIPSLVSGFSQIATGMDAMKKANEAFAKAQQGINEVNAAIDAKNVAEAAKNVGDVADKAKDATEAAEDLAEKGAKASKTAGDVAEAAKNVGEAVEGATDAGKVATDVVEGTTIAAKTGAGAATMLGGAIDSLKASFVAIKSAASALISIAALMGVVTIVSALIEKQKADIQATRDAADAALEYSDNLSTLKKTYEDTYKKYEEGQATSDELKTAADNLNAVLDDQAAKVAAANGQWETYNSFISAASTKKITAQDLVVKNGFEQAAADYSSAPGVFNRLQNKNVATASGALNFGGNQDLIDAYNNVGSISANASGKSFDFVAGTSTHQRLKDMDTLTETFSKQVDELNAKLPTLVKGTDEYEQTSQQLADAQERLSGIQQLRSEYAEEEATYQQSLQDTASQLVAGHGSEAAFQMTDGMSIEDYAANIKQRLLELGYSGDEVDDLVQEIINDMGQLGDATAENIQKVKTAEAANDAKMGFAQEAYTNTSGSEEEKNAAGDNIWHKLDDYFNDDEIISLKAQFSYEDLKDNIDEIIERLSSGEQLPDIIADLKVSDSSVNDAKKEISDIVNNDDYSDDNFSSKIADLDIDESQLKAYRSQLLSTNDALKQQKESVDSLNDKLAQQNKTLVAANRSLDSNSAEYKANVKRIQSNKDAIEDNNNALEAAVNKTIEAMKGAEELSSKYSSAAEVLQNSSASMTEMSDAVNELLPGVQHFLNLDMSNWSDSDKFAFITQNLQDIGLALDGDNEALMRLRANAAEEILIHAGIDENTQPEITAEMQEIIAEAQAVLPDIEAGADLNTQPFIQKLQSLLDNTSLTAEQVNAILTSLEQLGLEFELTKVKTTQKYQYISGDSDGNGNIIPTGTNSYYEATIEVPKLTAKKIGSLDAGYIKPSGGSTGGKKSSGGSGNKGSGSGKSYEPKTKDKDDSDLDRYEKVNAHLNKISASLDKLQAAQDRLSGKKLTENLAEQVKLLQEQVKWEQQKLEIEKQEAAEYRNILSSQYGVGFDSEGFITNYADIYNQLYNAYSSAVDRYNADTTEAGQEAADKEVEAAKKSLDSFKDYIDKYDTLLTSTITTSEKNIQDYYDKIEDIRIDAFKKAIDAAENIKDIQERLIDFNAIFRSLANYNEADEPFNDMVTNTEKLAKYWDVNITDMNKYYDDLIKNNKEALAQSGLSNERKNWLISRNEMYENAKSQLGKGTLEAGGTGYLDMTKQNVEDILEQMRQFEETGTSSIFGENSADLYDVAKTVFENATDMVSDYKDTLDDLKQNVLDGIDEIGDAIDDMTDKFDNINDTLDTYLDMIELVSGDQAYDKMNEVLAAQVKNSKAEIDVLQESIKQLKELQSTFEEGSDQWNAVADQITDKQNKLLETTKDTMDKMNSIYSNNVNSQLDKWLEGTPLGSDLDWMSDQWELINRNEDQYLDKTNSAYNIQKLQAKYLDLLDQSDNLLTQQKITDQMNQQLQMLRAKDKLSQYDVDYANAQLEILQKTIALQDAQNNKSQMKLKRDSQGNYSYVYGANEGDVKSAQSDLLDAQNNAYNLSKDQMKQVQDDSLSALQDAKSMLSDIWTNANLTLEEKTKRTQTIIDSLKEYLAGTSEQLSASEQNIIQDFIGMCEMMTDENKSGLQDTYDQIIAGNDDAFNDIDSRWGDSVAEWLKDMDSFNDATDKTFAGLQEDAKEYQKSMDALGDQVGLDFGNMTDAINKTKEATDSLTASTKSFYGKLDELTGKTKNAEKDLENYRDKILDLKNAMGTMQNEINSLGDKLTAKERENSDLSNQLSALQAKYDAATSSGGSGGSGSGGGGAESQDLTAKRIANSIWEYGDWGVGNTRKQRISERFGEATYDLVQSYFNGNPAYGYEYKDYSLGFERYDTGGYTGTWSASEGMSEGKNGKLAFLHQKELVLNEKDTANILEAVKNMRQMANSISSNGILNGMSGIEELVKSSISAISDMTSDVNVTQDVTINADFPNVSSYQEIEKAFNDLDNAAIQYVARASRFGRN